MNILEAVSDTKLFAQWFRDRTTWHRWLVFLAAFFGLPLTAEELVIYQRHTERKVAPTKPCREGWLICGRRAGKSFVLALIATYLACFREYRQHLQPGERGTILIIASDKNQARTILNYIKGFFEFIPMLRQYVEGETAASVDLSNAVTIEVGTASYKSTRGYTLVAALLDEAAFYPKDDSATPDTEILRAIRPGLATIPGSVLLVASSPYAKKGILYEAYRQHFGKEGDPILVWKATTREMNATIDQSLIDEAMAEDPIAAQAEYFAEFRSDVEGFVSKEALDAVTISVRERPYQPGTRYFAFTDPSGGKEDSFTLAIAHKEGETVCLDVIREFIPPFNPEFVCEQYANTMKTYGVTKCQGDHYAGVWPVEQFRKFGITYHQAARPKSELYQRLLPLINSGQVELLTHDRLLRQLQNLERRTTRSGKDSIDHPANSHDDVANAVAGVIALASDAMKKRATTLIVQGLGGGKVISLDREVRPRSWQRRIMTAEEARKRREAMN
ncbi:terminase family protein [Mesorhizobium sp. M2C.T.Ca.TU.002.02.1.1]|uniref:terminase large subunit domain-containing protein n=1 Tax=Mesorhizobium sp. M2C.T.Ca.TU.002.02.1.1 TaxID=2496788 RepID=UPI0019D0929E|nr:terminase family protein [Mesorhizobium sp. M2C.T.Ca.TU.002.02.1.1]